MLLQGTMIFPIVFPLAFSINESHTRRQTTLDNISVLKASMWTFHAFHSQWREILDEVKPGLGEEVTLLFQYNNAAACAC